MDTARERRSPLSFVPPARAAAIVLTGLFGLAGCASGGGIGKVVDKTLQAVGIKDQVPELPEGEIRVPLRLYAGQNLNAGNDGQALAAVVKVYQLRSARRFEQATFETFLDEEREREALGDDLIGVSEVVLTPGARHEVEERLPAEATSLGIVALFRAPASNRWRLNFDARHKNARDEGITLGLHACAITTSSPALTTRIPGDPASLASVQCMGSP